MITLVLRDNTVVTHNPRFYSITNDIINIRVVENSADVDYTYKQKDVASCTITNN